MNPNDHPDAPFVRYKSRHVVSWTLVNFTRLHTFPGALCPEASRSLRGRTVIVVGAGPSLALNGHHIAAAVERGAVVFCVNASDAPLRALGVTPDVMVVRESLELADQIAASKARCIVADLAVHPETWTAMEDRREGEARWFVPCYPRHMQQCRRLGVRPLFGGTAALTSAVSLALEWGARDVVLVGVDLAFARDGATYHPDAPRGAQRVVHDCDEQGREMLRFTGNDLDRARHERSGQAPQPELCTFEEVPAADWSGTLRTLPTMTSQRDWLVTEKARRPWLRARNASIGGAGIPGWAACDLAGLDVGGEPHADPGWDLPPGQVIAEALTSRLAADTLAEARTLEAICREMVDPLGPDLRQLGLMPRAAEGSRLVESLGEWRLLDAPTEMGAERCGYIYDAWRETAREAIALLERVQP